MSLIDDDSSVKEIALVVPKIRELWLEERRGGSTIGIGESSPRLSWVVSADTPQTAYELQLSGTGGIRTTGRIEGGESRLVDWPFEPLDSRQRVELRVRLWGELPEPGAWSAPCELEAGLLRSSDWLVDFVSPSREWPPATARPAFLLRAEFELPEGAVGARIYASAHGVYSLEVNGEPTTDELLAPGWSSYEHRIRYQTHDVTALLQPGRNAIGAWLADGWYRGRLGFNGGLWDNYGSDVSLLAQLEVRFADGRCELVPLHAAWKYDRSPIVAAGLYEGETFDARLFAPGWSRPGFDDEGWESPEILDRAEFPATIESPTGPPVRVIERLSPVSASRVENGRIRLDFGQNIAGKLELDVDAPAGHLIRLHHAEEIENGELATRPLRTAAAIDTFTGAGTGPETWTPRFTLHGFRYAEIENWPGEFDPRCVRAAVVHTDLKRSGWFESSNPMLNKLHSNIVWSMRDNFVDLPTDCPQRDERLGWTGDIQVFAPTASFLYGVYGTLDGWLRDLAAEQASFHSVPSFVPWIDCGFPPNPAAAWGDAAVIVPWVLYERFGDVSILEQQYESMRSWVEQMATLAGPGELWNDGFQLGDWLDPSAPPDNPADSTTDKYLVATAYRAHSTRILQQTANLLGRTEDASRYGDMFARILVAFQREFVTPNGRLGSDTPTAYSLAIIFELLTDAQRANAGRRLTELVEQSGFHISTGFVGTPIVCDALVAVGSTDAAYHLLLQEQCPSWLYPVTMGATTVWERWDSMLPDGSINPGEMTSFNHYALGAVADFMHRVVGGLASASPGYRTLRIAPRPGGGLHFASAVHETPSGRASSSWRRTGTRLDLDVEVPAGCTAIVSMPGADHDEVVDAGVHHFVGEFRAAESDPPRPRLFNIHNPEHRAARERGVFESTE